MSIEAEDLEHSSELESGNDQIIRRLDAVIQLLERIADVELDTTLEEIEE